MDVAKSKEERNTKKKMNTRGEEDHRLGAQPRERKKKPGERVLRNKTVFSLPAAKKRGRPEKQSEPATRGQTPPSLRSPSHFSLLPAVSLFFFPLISPALPPSSSSPKKGHTRTLFPFLESHVYSVSNVVDGRSWMTDRRCMYVCFWKCFESQLWHVLGVDWFSYSDKKVDDWKLWINFFFVSVLHLPARNSNQAADTKLRSEQKALVI